MNRAEAKAWCRHVVELIAAGAIVVRKIARGISGLPPRGVPKWIVLT